MIFKVVRKFSTQVYTMGCWLEILGTRRSLPQFPFEWQPPVSVAKPREEKRFFMKPLARERKRVSNNKTTSCLPQRIVAIFFLSHSGDSHSKKELNCRKLVKQHGIKPNQMKKELRKCSVADEAAEKEEKRSLDIGTATDRAG